MADGGAVFDACMPPDEDIVIQAVLDVVTTPAFGGSSAVDSGAVAGRGLGRASGMFGGRARSMSHAPTPTDTFFTNRQ